MENKEKPSLNEEEKRKLVEDVSGIHQIVEEISVKRKNCMLIILRHPLFLLFLSVIIIHLLIPKYQEQQANIVEKMKAKYQLLKEISIYNGKIVTVAENVIYLHQKPITYIEQIENTNKSFNDTYDEFNSNFIRVAFELKTIFEKESINQGWTDIQKELKELNDLLDLLHEFPTTDISEEHSKRIDICKKKIGEIKEHFDVISDSMIEILN